MNPYYEDSACTLYLGDNADVLPGLSGVDLFVTSPPYNKAGQPWPHWGHWKPGDSASGKSKWRNGSDGAGGVSYEVHADAMPHAKYVAWQKQVLTLCWEALSKRGAIYYNHKPRVIGGRLWLPLELNPNLPLRQIVIWARAGGLNYNPTAYCSTHEWIMILAKEPWRLKSKGASGAGDVWYIPQEANPDHPAPFPEELPRRAIETTAPRLVCDPFCGIGTTLIAAKRQGVRAIGIDTGESYLERAARALEQTNPAQVLSFPQPAPEPIQTKLALE